MLQKGDIVYLEKGMTVYADIPKHFVYDNRKGDWSICHDPINTENPIFSYLCGLYVVSNAYREEDGHGHGANDVYPGGWHVNCRRLDGSPFEVDFYQEGSFTAVIHPWDIKPICNINNLPPVISISKDPRAKEHFLKTGDIIELPINFYVNAQVPKHHKGNPGNWGIIDGQVIIGGVFDYLKGIYYVESAAFVETEIVDYGDDGSEISLEAYKVSCKRLDGQPFDVYFHQTYPSGNYSSYDSYEMQPHELERICTLDDMQKLAEKLKYIV